MLLMVAEGPEHSSGSRKRFKTFHIQYIFYLFIICIVMFSSLQNQYQPVKGKLIQP